MVVWTTSVFPGVLTGEIGRWRRKCDSGRRGQAGVVTHEVQGGHELRITDNAPRHLAQAFSHAAPERHPAPQHPSFSLVRPMSDF